MKNNLFTTALMLSMLMVPYGYAKGIPTSPTVNDDGTTIAKGIETGVQFIHIDDSAAVPNSASYSNATYKIDLHVSGKYALSSLAIALPEDISVDSVVVTDRSGKPIAANASVNDKKIAIAFNSPITSESYLQVRLKGVSTRWNYANTWLLPVSAKVDGMAGEIPLSLARIQTYN